MRTLIGLALNHWVRNAEPIFEASLAMEMLDFFGPDFGEGPTLSSTSALRRSRAQARVPQEDRSRRPSTSQSGLPASGSPKSHTPLGKIAWRRARCASSGAHAP
jgi:hypothetical protein